MPPAVYLQGKAMADPHTIVYFGICLIAAWLFQGRVCLFPPTPFPPAPFPLRLCFFPFPIHIHFPHFLGVEYTNTDLTENYVSTACNASEILLGDP